MEYLNEGDNMGWLDDEYGRVVGQTSTKSSWLDDEYNRVINKPKISIQPKVTQQPSIKYSPVPFNVEGKGLLSNISRKVSERDAIKTAEAAKKAGLTQEEWNIYTQGKLGTLPDNLYGRYKDIEFKLEQAKKTGVGRLFDYAGAVMEKTAFGAPEREQYYKQVGIESPTGSKVGDVAGQILGTIGGYSIPTGGVATTISPALSASNKLAKGIVKKLSSKLPKLLQKPVAQKALTGAIEDIPLSIYQGIVNKESVGDIAKRTAIEAPIGGALEVGMYGTGKLLKGIAKKLKGKTLKNVAETLETPVKKAEEIKKVVPTLTGAKQIKSQSEWAETLPKIQKTDEIELPKLKSAKKIIEPEIKLGEAIWSNKDFDQPVTVTGDLGKINGKRYVKIKESNTGVPLDEIKYFTQKQGADFQKFSGEVQDTAKAAEKAGTAETFRGKISREPLKKRKSFKEVYERVRTQFVDRFAPLERLEKDVRGGVESAEKSLYKQARLFAGVPEKASLIIEKELKPIIKAVEAKGLDYKDLGDYALAVHAFDVNQAGLTSGFTNQEIKAVLDKYNKAGLGTYRKQLVNLSNKLLDELVDANVLSKESVAAMREKWPNYMPLFRLFDDEKVGFAKGLSEAFANVGNPIKKLKGSERKVIDPIESMVKNIYKLTETAEKNRVGLQLSELAKEDVGEQFIRKLSDDEAVGRKNVVNIIENGKKVKYEVDPEVYKSMLNLNKEISPMWVKLFSKPASILRAGATLTPDFALRNPIRDVFNAFIVSKSGFNPFTDFAAGLASYIKKDELYDNFVKNLGGYGNIISMDRNTHRNVVEKIIKQPVSKKFVNIINPKSWLELLRTISDATESATKIGEFRAALRSGETIQEAAYRARDLMDFARAGSSTKELNKVVAFLNANIQGKSKFIRAIKENPVKVGSKLLYTMALPSIAAYAITEIVGNEKQKAIIKDAENWLRDSFWLIPVPGTDIVARIPKPFEGAAVSNTLERFLDYTMKNDKTAYDGFIKQMIKEQSMPVMMSGMVPIIEGMTNYSFFREASIVPEREKYLRPRDQYDIYTSEISKWLAGAVEKIAGEESKFASPRIMENVIRGTTAGLGGYALEATDKLLGKKKPAKTVTQQPVLKAFTVNEMASGKSVDYIYNQVNKLTKEKNSAKLRKEMFKKQSQLNYLENVSEQLSDISKRIRDISNSTKYTPKEKRDMIKKLVDKRNEIAIKARDKIVPKLKASEKPRLKP